MHYFNKMKVFNKRMVAFAAVVAYFSSSRTPAVLTPEAMLNGLNSVQTRL